MLNILAAEGGNQSWIMLVVLAVMFVLMMILSIVPQKKRQKEAQKMMDSLRPGTKIKTIGGFVGQIKSIDAQANLITVDLSAKLDGSNLCVLDKSAVYAVMQAANGTLEEAPQVPDVAKDDVKAEEVKDEPKEI